MADAFEALRSFDPGELRDPHSGKWTSGAVSGATRKVAKSLASAFKSEGLSSETHQAEGSYGDVAFAAHGTGDIRMAFHDSESGELREMDLSHEETVGLADAVDELAHARDDLDESDHQASDPFQVARVDFGADSEHSASLYSNGLIELKFYELDDAPPYVLALDPGEKDGEGDDVPEFARAIDGAVSEGAQNASRALPFNAFEALRNFSPGELRDPDGKWTKSPKTELKDTLKLADRIQLNEGETFAGSLSDAKKVLNLLAKAVGDSGTAARSASAGAPLGGQFALGGGHVAGQGQRQATKRRPAHATTAKPKAPAGPQRLGYDAKTNRGAGYGVKGGDPNVRILQADMNRLGLGDEHGKALAVDGRYGPHTTASVKKLQKSLGLAQTGQVDANFIKQVSALKALPTHPPARTVPRKVVAHRSADTHGGIMQSGTSTRRNPQVFDRSYPLDDIQISRSGDGRTVEAYAAIFGQPYEVHDGYGHYMEVIDRAAFNRTLTGGAGKQAMCLYNHGMTVHGTADALSSVPLGTPLEIKADTRGLLTVTRYNRSALADSVLESIRNGDIRAQSFRGRIVRSSPDNVPRVSRGAALPTITRHELGLTDYGPTPIPVNAGAEIMAVRSLTELIEDFQQLDDAERDQLLRALDISPSTLDGDSEDDEEIERSDDTSTTSSHDELGAEDSPTGHSGRLLIARAALTAQLRLRGVIRG